MQKNSKMVKNVPAVGVRADRKDAALFDSAVPVFFKGKKGKVKCAAFVELADTPERQRVGLSKRASLGKMSGMVFSCTGPFWMKDVEFPLDLVFTDDSGRILEKTAMAVDKEGRTLYPSSVDGSTHAVELPYGFCDRHGIEVGDTITADGEE